MSAPIPEDFREAFATLPSVHERIAALEAQVATWKARYELEERNKVDLIQQVENLEAQVRQLREARDFMQFTPEEIALAESRVNMMPFEQIIKSLMYGRYLAVNEHIAALETQVKELTKLNRWQAESLASFRSKFDAKSNCEAIDAIDEIKAQNRQLREAFRQAVLTWARNSNTGSQHHGIDQQPEEVWRRIAALAATEPK